MVCGGRKKQRVRNEVCLSQVPAVTLGGGVRAQVKLLA
jgi:hypothetical protein